MLIFNDTTDPRISNLPPPYQAPVLSAIRTLWKSLARKHPVKTKASLPSLMPKIHQRV